MGAAVANGRPIETPITDEQNTMGDHDSRQVLTDLRHSLLRLHKTLLDWERAAYEKVHGRQSGGDLLKLLLDDPQFAWLRPMSQAIVRIDEMLEEDNAPAEREVDDVLASVMALTSLRDAREGQGLRYSEALQDSPDVVVAHRDVAVQLGRRG
jgi:hypothetical protein